MAGKDATRATTIVIGDEEIFLELMQRFPAHRYPLIFAADPREAQALCTTQRVLIVIVPVTGRDIVARLGETLSYARQQGAQVLGLASSAEIPPEVAERVDRVVARENVAGVLAAAADLLQEQRHAARADVEIPVTVDGIRVTATAVSDDSLFVRTEQPPPVGAGVTLAIATGETELSCRATVHRVATEGDGPRGMVLAIAQQAEDVRTYLDAIVRGALLVERAELSTEDPRTILPTSLGSRLLARVGQEVAALRTRLQVQASVTDALADHLGTQRELLDRLHAKVELQQELIDSLRQGPRTRKKK